MNPFLCRFCGDHKADCRCQEVASDAEFDLTARHNATVRSWEEQEAADASTRAYHALSEGEKQRLRDELERALAVPRLSAPQAGDYTHKTEAAA